MKAVEGFPLPIYTCIGNHDDGDPVALGDHYNDELGRTSTKVSKAHSPWSARFKDHGDQRIRHLPQIDAIPTCSNQEFMNILINACHAIAGKGEVRIRTTQEDDSIIVSFTDSGKVIPEEDLARTFDPASRRRAWKRTRSFQLSTRS